MKWLASIITVIIVSGAAFYGGMTFQKSRDSLAGLSGEALTNKMASLGMTTGGTASRDVNSTGFPGGTFPGDTNGTGRMNGGGMVTGEIVSANSQSMTVRQQNGTTTTIYYSDSTDISKTSSGTFSDLSSGTDVAVTGTTNTDGSVTARSIRINPEMLTGNPGAYPSAY